MISIQVTFFDSPNRTGDPAGDIYRNQLLSRHYCQFDLPLIVNNLHGPGHAAVEKDGVPDHPENFSGLSADFKGLGHPHPH